MSKPRNPLVLVGAFAVGILIAVVLFGSMARAQTAAAERGETIYDHWCAPCHAPGQGHPGTQSLEVKYRGELPAVLTEREDLTGEFVRTMVREGILSMVPFRKTEITDAELEDLAAYLTQ